MYTLWFPSQSETAKSDWENEFTLAQIWSGLWKFLQSRTWHQNRTTESLGSCHACRRSSSPSSFTQQLLLAGYSDDHQQPTKRFWVKTAINLRIPNDRNSQKFWVIHQQPLHFQSIPWPSVTKPLLRGKWNDVYLSKQVAQPVHGLVCDTDLCWCFRGLGLRTRSNPVPLANSITYAT